MHQEFPTEERPRCWATDDGWIRTHEDAAQLLKYAAIGATVVFDPLKRSKTFNALNASREFTVVFDAAPRHAVNARDFYALPCKAAPLAARIRTLCETAKASLVPLEL